MTHGYKNVLGEERIQTPLFETGNATLDAVLTDWFFGTGGATNLTNAGNIASAFASGAAAIALVLTATGISGAEAFGTAGVSTGVNLTNAGNIASAEVFGAPGVSYSLTPAGLGSGAAYGNPSLTPVLSAIGLVSGESLGSPAVSLTVTPTGIAGGEAFGTASVEEVAAPWLYPVGIDGAEVLGKPTVAQAAPPLELNLNKLVIPPSSIPHQAVDRNQVQAFLDLEATRMRAQIKLKKALLQEEIDAAQTKADKEIQERIENAKKDRHHDNNHLDFQMQRLQEEEKAVARMQNKRRLEDGRAILADKRLEERKRRK